MKTILLDLGGVVFESVGKSSPIIDWKIVSALNNKYGHQLNIGTLEATVFLAEYNAQTHQNLSLEQFLEAIFDTIQFNQELVANLSARYEIYILSDNYRENIAYISKRYRFEDWSKGQFYSFDFGVGKYEGTLLFEQVLNALGKPANEVLFIDDSADKLENASQIGIQGIQFKNNQQVFQELEKITLK